MTWTVCENTQSNQVTFHKVWKLSKKKGNISNTQRKGRLLFLFFLICSQACRRSLNSINCFNVMVQVWTYLSYLPFMLPSWFALSIQNYDLFLINDGWIFCPSCKSLCIPQPFPPPLLQLFFFSLTPVHMENATLMKIISINYSPWRLCEVSMSCLSVQCRFSKSGLR